APGRHGTCCRSSWSALPSRQRVPRQDRGGLEGSGAVGLAAGARRAGTRPLSHARGQRSWQGSGARARTHAVGHGPARDAVLAVLRRYAPLWLIQLPGRVSEPELERLQRQVAGATPARMRRELAQALDVLTADAPLVLVLEDLQWSDASTVDLLAYLAQRREPAQLLVLGTYRPVDLVLHAHPLHGLV